MLRDLVQSEMVEDVRFCFVVLVEICDILYHLMWIPIRLVMCSIRMSIQICVFLLYFLTIL